MRRLPPKEMQLVVALARWGAEYAPAADLRAELGASSAYLSELISVVRETFGASAIEMAPGRGYRLSPKVLAAASR